MPGVSCVHIQGEDWKTVGMPFCRERAYVSKYSTLSARDLTFSDIPLRSGIAFRASAIELSNSSYAYCSERHRLSIAVLVGNGDGHPVAVSLNAHVHVGFSLLSLFP